MCTVKMNIINEMQFVLIFSGSSPRSVFKSSGPSPVEIIKTFFHLLLQGRVTSTISSTALSVRAQT